MNNEENNETPTPNSTPKPQPPFGQKKVFDVVRPGKAPASASSRPIIVGHKPQVQDDQFVPSTDSTYATDNPFDKHALMSHKDEADINPSVETVPTEVAAKTEEQGSATTTPPAPATEEPKPTPVEEDPSKPKVEVPDLDIDVSALMDEEPVPAEAAGAVPAQPTPAPVDTPEPPAPLNDTKAEQPKPEEKPSPQGMAVDQTVEKPAEEPMAAEAPESTTPAPVTHENQSGSLGSVVNQDDLLAATNAPILDHAMVSHHKTHTKWWEWLLIVLLIVVIALVALNFLLDAEVIKTSLNIPHTNLIKN